MINTAFSIPIFQYSVKDWEPNVKKKLLKSLVPYLSANTDFHDDGGGWAGNHKKPNYMNSVLDILEDSLIEFSSDLNHSRDQLVIRDMWYEKLNKYDYHECHNHGAIGYSACLYVHFNKQVHTPTKFHGPYLGFLNGDSLFFQPEVEEGDIILFPSALRHEAPINISDEARIVISFNIKSPLWG
tara:strand:+ start:1380 stop:1931 length:552 start_codon:yes stop_codon:yes gene_type:complete